LKIIDLSSKEIKIIIITIAILIGCLSACQPTPDNAAVMNKGNANLQESIKKTANPNGNGSTNKETEWKYTKSYNSGNSLIVDAVLYNADAYHIPVLSVSPKMYESGEQIKKIVDLFCPNIKVYDQGDKATKQQLEQAIIDVRNEIFNVENNLPPHPGADPIPEENKEHYIEGLKNALAYYEQQMSDSPDESELNEASYQLGDRGGSFQSNMIANLNGAIIYIDFVNWDMGTDFILKSTLFNEQNVGTYAKYVTPVYLEDDTEFMKAREKAEQYVAAMGIDYMSISSVSKGEGSYSFYYTRTYKGLQETYVKGFIGTTATAVDNGPVIYLWDPEYLYMEIQDGNIVVVEWHNRTEITNVDNENVQTISWEEAKQIFMTQIDYLLMPEPIINGNQSSAFFDKTEVHINRIELGLTKLLMKDSKDNYKLIPTWSFMGYETSVSRPTQERVNIGAEICFITINAIDGTIIDRGLMY